MTKHSPSERRMMENEVVFRGRNESMQEGFENLEQIAKEDGQESLVTPDTVLYFWCECADENCRQRLQLAFDQYAAIHKQRNQFVVIRGHEVPSIEKIVDTEPGYYVVQKFGRPPASAAKLQSTPITNA